MDFAAFVEARGQALLRAAYLLTGDRHLAEDLVWSALARTHLHWNRVTRDGHVEAYTRKVMYRLQVSWWRRRRVTESMPGTVPEVAGDNHDETVAARITLRQALLRLSNRQRAVLVLRFYEDRTETETAEMLGVSVGTVKRHTARAVERMRQIVPELAPFDQQEVTR